MAGPESPSKARQTPRQRAQRTHNVAVSSDMGDTGAPSHPQRGGNVAALEDKHGGRVPTLASPHSMEFGRRSGKRFNRRWMLLLWWGVPVVLLLLSVILQTAILMGLSLSSVLHSGRADTMQGAQRR